MASSSVSPDDPSPAGNSSPAVILWWIPVGAGGHVVVHTSRCWEWLRALRAHRRPRPLFHAALEVSDGDLQYVLEMTPVWGQPPGPRGVIVRGPVGLRWLGASRFFQYEVRCWAGGSIPDRDWAVGAPVRFPLTSSEVHALITRVPLVPRLTWGRDAFGIADMWNSNSLIAWVLQSNGIDARRLLPPRGGDAPGWRSGVVAALSDSESRPGADARSEP